MAAAQRMAERARAKGVKDTHCILCRKTAGANYLWRRMAKDTHCTFRGFRAD